MSTAFRHWIIQSGSVLNEIDSVQYNEIDSIQYHASVKMSCGRFIAGGRDRRPKGRGKGAVAIWGGRRAELASV